MRVIVCVKQVDYVYHPIAIGKQGDPIDPEKMVQLLNPYDEIAVEEAIRVKESFRDCEVIVMTAGPPTAEKALRDAFAFGADQMIRINHDRFDPWSTSLLLAEVIKGLGYDFLLLGKKAIDQNANLVGSFVAESLNIPQVSGIIKLDIFPDERKAVVERYLGRGNRDLVECSLPALFTVENGLNDPRYPSLANRLAAARKKIEVIDGNSLGLCFDGEMDLARFMSISPPRPKPKKIFTPESSLPASERMKLIRSGGSFSKKSRLIEGGGESVASQVVEALVHAKVL